MTGTSATSRSRLRAPTPTRRRRTAPRPVRVPCAPVETLLPKLTITKTANRTALPAVGQTIVYTVTVKNTGPGDFTAAHLATFSDDLSAVLDDATMNAADHHGVAWDGDVHLAEPGVERHPACGPVRGDHLHADLHRRRRPPARQLRLHPGDRGPGPGRHLPHRVGARLGAAPPQERRPGLRHPGPGRPGAHLHADLRERRAGRRDRRHQRRPVRRPGRRPAGRYADRGRGPDRHGERQPARRHRHACRPGRPGR